MTRFKFLSRFVVLFSLVLLVGCGGAEGPVTPVAAEQEPTSAAPVGKEPVLTEEGP